MRKIYTIAVLLTASSWSVAQTINELYIIDGSVNPGGVIDEFKLPPPSTTGSYYLYDNWNSGEVTVRSRYTLKNFPLRYDVEHHQLEINVDSEIKVCSTSIINSFTWVNENGDSSTFVPCRYYAPEVGGHGVFEVLYKNGDTQLLSLTEIIQKDATYVAALDVGSRNNQLIKKETFYLAKDHKIQKIESSRKKNQALLGNRYDQVVEYVKKEKLRFNNREDLIQILTYYIDL